MQRSDSGADCWRGEITSHVRSVFCSSFRRLRAPGARANSEAGPKGERQRGASQAGIQFLVLGLQGRASTRPTGERVTFFACAKKGNQRNTPPSARLPGILPSRSARELRGSLDARPCAFSERAHIVCALLRTDPTHPRRASGGPVWAASCRRSQDSFQTRVEVVQGRTDSWINGAVRGAEHRRRGGRMPEGSRQWIAAIAKQYRDVLSEQPRRDEKRRGFCRARSAAKHRVRRLAFWLLLGTAPQERREQRSWRRSRGGQDARSHAKSNSLARRASESPALQIKLDSGLTRAIPALDPSGQLRCSRAPVRAVAGMAGKKCNER